MINQCIGVAPSIFQVVYSNLSAFQFLDIEFLIATLYRIHSFCWRSLAVGISRCGWELMGKSSVYEWLIHDKVIFLMGRNAFFTTWSWSSCHLTWDPRFPVDSSLVLFFGGTRKVAQKMVTSWRVLKDSLISKVVDQVAAFLRGPFFFQKLNLVGRFHINIHK